MNDHTLAAEYINAGYNHKTILSDVSVTIPQNKISVILGANGCGKSTLLKTFARLLAPQSGQMILDGKMFLKFHPDKWQKCSAFCRSHLSYRRESG